MTDILRIATRKSPLALWQAEFVREQLLQGNPGLEVELRTFTTRGDRVLDSPLAKIGGKGLFVKELEQAMLDGEADIAVHSTKDVPMELPPGLELPVILARHDPRDALVSASADGLDGLAAGARVGTSSLRRRCQLLALRPDLEVIDLRGNVNTRLAKLDAGDYDAILLACAGLERMGMQARISEALDPQRFLPAIAQGAISIECRADDASVRALIDPLHHADTAVCVRAERACNRRLLGGCQVPVAGHAELGHGVIVMRALVGETDGSRIIDGVISGRPGDAEELGEVLADDLLSRGAGEILQKLHEQQ